MKELQYIREDISLARCFELVFPGYDGNTTKLLEFCFQTTIKVQILLQQQARLEFDIADGPFQKGDPVIDRRVLLQQEETGENFLYADSVLAPDALPHVVRLGIQDTRHPRPLGKVLQDVPVCRYILSCEQIRAGASLADYFSINPESLCLVRTSLLSFEMGPAIFIQETIPYRFTSPVVDL